MLPEAQAIIDLLPDLALLVETDGAVADGNLALCRALQLDRASLVGRSIFELVDTPAERAAEYLRRCAATRQPFPGALVLRRRDGARLECRCDGARTRLSGGAPGPILLRCRRKSEAVSRFTLLNKKIVDLTREIWARRSAEEELRRVTESLEQRVGERTRQLTETNERLVAEGAERRKVEAELHQAQKMEAVGQLTGGVAHDFNNLLTVVLGALDALEVEIADGRLGRLVQSAKRAASRGANLTAQLLAFSRKQLLRPQSTDVNRLIGGMGELLRGTLGSKIELRQSFAADAWPVLCDAHQLESGLLNIVLNARDAMPTGGAVTVETANVRLDAQSGARPLDPVQAGDYVRVAVTDTGSGIPPEAIDRIFEPFFSTKEMGKGTGLGLSQVYGFVKQSGGHVRVYSEVGVGTTVKLYLPRSPEHAAKDAPEAAPAHRAALGQTVLVVEDDATVRDVAVDLLKGLGYSVLEAADGRAALRLLRDEQGAIDLLFTDVIMPGPSGFEVAREALTIRPTLKVLFTSGYTANALPAERPFAGRLINKPYRAIDLAREVQDILDAREASPAARP